MIKSLQEKQGLATRSRGCKPPEAAHMPGMPEVETVGKFGFVSHAKHIAEATNMDLFHS